jgi:hypothetical protein
MHGAAGGAPRGNRNPCFLALAECPESVRKLPMAERAGCAMARSRCAPAPFAGGVSREAGSKPIG